MKKFLSAVIALTTIAAFACSCTGDINVPSVPVNSSSVESDTASQTENSSSNTDNLSKPENENSTQSDVKEESSFFPDESSTNETSSKPEEDYDILDENGKINLIGYYLDDALNVCEACGLDNAYIKYQSLDGSMIIVKNNWEIVTQKVEGKRLYLICDKTREDGIIDSFKDTFDNLINGVEKLGIANKDLTEILSYFEL